MAQGHQFGYAQIVVPPLAFGLKGPHFRLGGNFFLKQGNEKY